MSDYYIVFIEPNPGTAVEAIQAKMDLAIDWFRITPNLWILYTSSDEDKWQVRLKPLVDPGGALFISLLNIERYNGWMTQKFWDWIEKKR
jgi:hypothetical protein